MTCPFSIFNVCGSPTLLYALIHSCLIIYFFLARGTNPGALDLGALQDFAFSPQSAATSTAIGLGYVSIYMQGGSGHWAVYYLVPQSFIRKIS